MSIDEKLATIASRWSDLRAEKEELEAKLKDVNLEIMQIAERDIPQMLDDAGLDSVKVKGIGTVYLQGQIQVAVLSDNQPKLIEYMISEGHSDLVKETVHPGTLKSWVKERLDENLEVPDFIQVRKYMAARLRKG